MREIKNAWTQGCECDPLEGTVCGRCAEEDDFGVISESGLFGFNSFDEGLAELFFDLRDLKGVLVGGFVIGGCRGRCAFRGVDICFVVSKDMLLIVSDDEGHDREDRDVVLRWCCVAVSCVEYGEVLSGYVDDSCPMLDGEVEFLKAEPPAHQLAGFLGEFHDPAERFMVCAKR